MLVIIKTVFRVRDIAIIKPALGPLNAAICFGNYCRGEYVSCEEKV